MADQDEEGKKAKSEASPEAADGPHESRESKSKANSKVTQMTPAEVETALSRTESKMGGYQSRYARHLLAKQSLFGDKTVSLSRQSRKAA